MFLALWISLVINIAGRSPFSSSDDITSLDSSSYTVTSPDSSSYTEVSCSPGEFQCGSGECLPPFLKCDLRKDCEDGSDESDINCGNTQ